jgi:hypothetical protein
MRRLLTGVVTAGSLLAPTFAVADQARDWQNIPKDLNLVMGYYVWADSDRSIDSSLPISDAKIEANIALARVGRSFAIGSHSAAVQFIIPYAWLDGKVEGTSIEQKRDGIADITGIFAYNILGGPALSLEEFTKWQPETFLTGSLWISAPLGKYSNDHLINTGTNRWSFKPELSFGHPFGKSWIEANVFGQFYTTNTDYLGHNDLDQKPMLGAELHYSYSVLPSLWLSADAYYNYGGATEINDGDSNGKQSTLKLGAGLGFNFSPAASTVISYAHTVAKRDSTPESQYVIASLRFAF